MRILFCLLLLLAASPARAASWPAVTEYPATSMPGEGLTTLAARMAARTQGAIDLAPRFDGPDGLRSATIPQAVREGRVIVGDAFAGALEGLDPIFQLSSLPFVATSAAEAQRLYAAARPAYEQAFEKLGQHLLYATPWPASGIWSRHPVRSAADVVGLSVRTYDAAGTDVLRRAGAKSVLISFADAMPRLRDGSVDAVLSSGDGGAGRKLWEFLPNFTEIGYAMPLSFATVNRAAYAALGDAMRAEIDAAARETEAAQWAALTTRTARNQEVMRRNGVAILSPDPSLAAALAAASGETIAAWRAKVGEQGAAILAAFRKD
jgi:TRAP-type C4-dicarboxylate transport system substrate-binding protein